jgi:hypothetical protein
MIFLWRRRRGLQHLTRNFLGPLTEERHASEAEFIHTSLYQATVECMSALLCVNQIGNVSSFLFGRRASFQDKFENVLLTTKTPIDMKTIIMEKQCWSESARMHSRID